MAQRRDSSLKSTRLLAHLRGIVAAVRAGQLDERGDASLFDRDAAEMVHLTNELIDELVRPLRVASGSLAEIAAGNIPDFVIDEYQGEFDTIKRNINTFLATMQGMQHEAQDLISAITSGKLHARGNDWDFQGGWRDLIGGMNNVVDAFERPFAVAKGCVQEISDGRMPPPIERGFKGDYGRLAKDLNGLVCTVRTMTSAIVALSQSAVSGELDRRLNSNEFSGDWAALVTGINATLDAALAPIKEAGEVLGRVADYDLRVRVEGDYAGDHARIKNAVNQTTDTLNRALLQVTQSAEAVANGSGRIAEMSREVTVGTKRQVVAVEDVTRRAGTLLAQAEANAKLSKQALLRAEEVVVAVDTGKSSAERAAGVIEEIVCATEASTAVIQEINAIAAQTDSLAGSANAEAAKVAASGRGFAVVADEVRRLAQQSKIAANKMDSLVVEIGRILRVQGNGSEVTTRDALFSVIQEIQQIAFQTNMLAVNAAVEAAHVAAASAGFEAITDEVRNLAQRVKGAAERTDTLTRSAHTAAENGREITKLVERDLSQIVEGVREMIGSMQEIADKSGDQQVAMRAMTAAMGEIQAVTDSNAKSAGSSTTVADSLASEVSALANLVGRFKLDESGGRESKCSRATPKA